METTIRSRWPQQRRGMRRPAGLVALIALVVALVPTSASAQVAGFPDVAPSNTHAQAIAALADAGVLRGRTDGTFRPNEAITRGQLAAVLFRTEDHSLTAPRFSDVSASHPHAAAIGAMAAAGVVEGYADGTFRPGEPIRREHVALMIARWLGASPSTADPFDDVTRYGGQIGALYELGVVNGFADGRFVPGAPLNRQQAASFVHRALDVLDNGASLKLLSFNDVHGRLEPPSDRGGVAYLMTHLERIRAEHRATLTVDAGDLVGATPVLSNLFLDEPTVRAANLFGLDVQTAGNHEFDRGRDEMLRRAEGGCSDAGCVDDQWPFEGQDFSTLTANVIDTTTGEPFMDPYEVRAIAGMRVGFIGVVTQSTPQVVNPTGIENLEFLPEHEAVNTWLPVLEEDEDVDVVVVLMHEGGRQDQGDDPNSCEGFAGAATNVIPQFDDGVDVVVTGHTHQAYICDLEDGPLVTQALEYGQLFTETDLRVDLRSGEVIDRGAVNHEVTHDVEPHPAMVELIDYYRELAGPALEEIVGTSTVEIPRTTRVAESAQGNLATDALLDQYAAYDIDFAFQNSGGLRADLTDAEDTDNGLFNIRRRHVLGVWPFGNITALAEIDGEQLEALLSHGVSAVGAGHFIQVGGLRIEYEIVDTTGEFPEGQLVTVEFFNHHSEPDGTPVDLSADATYRIALNDFMSVGGDGYPDISNDVFALQNPLEIDVENYLLANSPVSPAVEGRIVDITDN